MIKIKKIATFYVAWNGEGAGSFFGIFATSEEAGKMNWLNTSWQTPRLNQPRVTKWVIGVTGGNPVILEPSYFPHYDKVGKYPEVANVPFRSPGFKNDNRYMPTHVPIKKNGMTGNETEVSSLWNPARKALLDYYELFHPTKGGDENG